MTTSTLYIHGAVDADLSASGRAYRAIREMIVTLELPPGSVVSERELMERLGLGRTPVREALRDLAREQLVEVYPRRGMFVSGVDVGDMAELIEVRLVLDIAEFAQGIEYADLPLRREVAFHRFQSAELLCNQFARHERRVLVDEPLKRAPRKDPHRRLQIPCPSAVRAVVEVLLAPLFLVVLTNEPIPT